MYGSLTIEQAAKLASAGIAMTFHEIEPSLNTSPHQGPPPMMDYQRNSPEDLLSSLRDRLTRRRVDGELMFPSITSVHCTLIDGDKVAVFVAAHGKAQILEDELALFPSDTLITQIRLIEGK